MENTVIFIFILRFKIQIAERHKQRHFMAFTFFNVCIISIDSLLYFLTLYSSSCKRFTWKISFFLTQKCRIVLHKHAVEHIILNLKITGIIISEKWFKNKIKFSITYFESLLSKIHETLLCKNLFCMLNANSQFIWNARYIFFILTHLHNYI